MNNPVALIMTIFALVVGFGLGLGYGRSSARGDERIEVVDALRLKGDPSLGPCAEYKIIEVQGCRYIVAHDIDDQRSAIRHLYNCPNHR